MSRRTKLLIAALFLVLLAVPAVDIALSWQPENPLRFRIVKDQGVQNHGVSPERRLHRFAVEVKNVSRVPVKLFSVYLVQEGPTSSFVGDLEPWLLTPPHFTTKEGRTADFIPPGGAIYIAAKVDDENDIRVGETRVPYTALSRTKANCMRWSGHIIEYLPTKIQVHMPRIEPTQYESTLDVSLLLSSPAHHPTETTAPQ